MKRCPPPCSPLTKAQRARLSRYPGLRGLGSMAVFTPAHARALKRGQMQRYRSRLKQKKCTTLQQQFSEKALLTPTATGKAKLAPVSSTDSQNFRQKSQKRRFLQKTENVGYTGPASTKRAQRKHARGFLARVPNRFPSRPLPWSSLLDEEE